MSSWAAIRGIDGEIGERLQRKRIRPLGVVGRRAFARRDASRFTLGRRPRTLTGTAPLGDRHPEWIANMDDGTKRMLRGSAVNGATSSPSALVHRLLNDIGLDERSPASCRGFQDLAADKSSPRSTHEHGGCPGGALPLWISPSRVRRALPYQVKTGTLGAKRMPPPRDGAELPRRDAAAAPQNGRFS